MLLTRGFLPATLGLLLALDAGGASAQEQLTRHTPEEAVALATRANPIVRAKQFEYQAWRQ